MTPCNQDLTPQQIVRLHAVIIHHTTRRLAWLMFSDRTKRFEFLRNTLGYTIRTARLNKDRDIIGMNMDRGHYQDTLQAVNQAIRENQRARPSEQGERIKALQHSTKKSCDTILQHLREIPPSTRTRK